MNIHARPANVYDRPDPEPLSAFTVTFDGIDIRMGVLELVARDRFRVSCRWSGPVIDVDCIEVWLTYESMSGARFGEWETLDGHADPDVQTVLRRMRAHFESPNGQRELRAACDAQEHDAALEGE